MYWCKWLWKLSLTLAALYGTVRFDAITLRRRVLMRWCGLSCNVFVVLESVSTINGFTDMIHLLELSKTLEHCLEPNWEEFSNSYSPFVMISSIEQSGAMYSEWNRIISREFSSRWVHQALSDNQINQTLWYLNSLIAYSWCKICQITMNTMGAIVDVQHAPKVGYFPLNFSSRKLRWLGDPWIRASYRESVDTRFLAREGVTVPLIWYYLIIEIPSNCPFTSK